MTWSVTGQYLAGMPETITGDSFDELEAKIRGMYPTRNLEFEGYTDQLDVFCRRPSGKRDRFMTLMA